jgi:hypothetical protein
MNLRPGDAAGFFAPSPGGEEALALRGALLDSEPGHYSLVPASDSGSVREALAWLGTLGGRKFDGILDAGRSLEPDWVLLCRGDAAVPRVEAGVVCFPSHWSLPEKAGLPMTEVHAPVPGFNADLGTKTNTFLDRLAPGAAWERENWGLSADEELDHHPRLHPPKLTGTESPDRIWIRLEQQLLVRLSGSSILFGIRVTSHRLDHLCDGDLELRPRIARALRSMPEEAAHYKGLSGARSGILRELEE